MRNHRPILVYEEISRSIYYARTQRYLIWGRLQTLLRILAAVNSIPCMQATSYMSFLTHTIQMRKLRVRARTSGVWLQPHVLWLDASSAHSHERELSGTWLLLTILNSTGDKNWSRLKLSLYSYLLTWFLVCILEWEREVELQPLSQGSYPQHVSSVLEPCWVSSLLIVGTVVNYFTTLLS